MAANKLQWKRIAKGDRLPCDSLLMKKDGTIPSVVSGAGVKVGQDAYYLSVEELKSFPKEESENEKTKRLLHTIACKIGQHLRDIFTEEEFQCFDAWSNAWLEKQGEHANFLNKIQIGDKVTRNEDGILINLSQLNRVAKKDEKQGEQKHQYISRPKYIGEEELLGKQKPAEWSEDDEVMLRFAIEHFERQKRNSLEDGGRRKVMQEFIDWLKSLKDRALPQPKQEWSEKDERIKNNLLSELTNLSVRKLIKKETEKKYASWLKILRPQSQWKPSDEQIMALRWVLNHIPYDSHKEEISALLEQLKKLREGKL